MSTNFDEFIAPHYPALLQKASKRLELDGAPNLCGLKSYSAISGQDTADLLKVLLSGGWRHGLLPIVQDVALFAERHHEFTERFGEFNISELTALLMDAIRRSDNESIQNAIEALKPKDG